MVVLGFDPSLTNFGWATCDLDAPPHQRCLRHGRFQTSAKNLYISRYTEMRGRVLTLLEEVRPDALGIEFPVFGQLYSEGMYGLFLYTSEAAHEYGIDVVFWSPLQIKAHAREMLNRPNKWVMGKPDMVEAAQVDTKGGRWNHNEADAYLCARLSHRFWGLMRGDLDESDLTDLERKFFLDVKTPQKGKDAGKTILKGIAFREDERFFRWSRSGDVDGKEEGDGRGVGDDSRSSPEGGQAHELGEDARGLKAGAQD